jgi:hypothetical protein
VDDDDGAGFGGGFCAGLCANAGEIGPTISKLAKSEASSGLTSCVAARFAAPKEINRMLAAFRIDRRAVPQRVLIMMFPPRYFCPHGTFFIGPNSVKRSNY